MSTGDLLDEIAQLRAEVRELRSAIRPKPITSWARVAELLNTSVDTVRRRRKAAGDVSASCWFSSSDAVIEWWTDLLAPAPAQPAPRRRRVKAPHRERALDANALVRELLGKHR